MKKKRAYSLHRMFNVDVIGPGRPITSTDEAHVNQINRIGLVLGNRRMTVVVDVDVISEGSVKSNKAILIIRYTRNRSVHGRQVTTNLHQMYKMCFLNTVLPYYR